MPKYSRKDYIEIASLLKTHPNRKPLFESYIARFEKDNPRFDKKRFWEAVFGVPAKR